jgi:hypothetical protein
MVLHTRGFIDPVTLTGSFLLATMLLHSGPAQCRLLKHDMPELERHGTRTANP